MFNSAVGLQYLHMYLAAVMVVGCSVAGVYAVGWLRGRRDDLHRLGIVIPFLFAAVASPLQPVVGHFAGQRLADEQPIKLAAMEGLARPPRRPAWNWAAGGTGTSWSEPSRSRSTGCCRSLPPTTSTPP